MFFIAFEERFEGAKFLIFVTNWALLLWVLYVVWAAISVTIAYLRAVYLFFTSKQESNMNEGHCTHQLLVEDRPVGCCGVGGDRSFWYQKIQWLLYSVNMPVAVAVIILYWALLYDPDIDRGYSYFDGVNLHTHLFNGIMSVVDIWVTAVPIRLLSMVYAVTFGASYIAFSGIYYAANGTNTNDNPYIYSFLDYGSDPTTAIGIIVATLFVLLPLTHLICYSMYLMREGVLYLVGLYCCKSGQGPDHTDVEMQELK